MTEKEEITVAEAGRRGGTATRDRHGIGFYRRIGAKGGESTKKLYGHLFSELGKRGGRPKRPTLDSAGGRLPEKKGGEMRSAPGSSSPAKIITQK
jgi:hypothetical protein